MTAHIINIGDELLIGQVVNTNASWMAEELNKRNIKVTNISVISDGGDDIRTQLDKSLAEADVVLITGGLGPTKDDITKTVLCEYFGDTLVRHQPTYDQVQRFFERRGLPFTEINQAQALVPSRCKVILNEVGTAPCMVFTMHNAQPEVLSLGEKCTVHNSEKIVVSMPGVPFEMKWLMQNSVLPLLQERLGSDAIVHKTILTFGIGESFLADKIADWEDALPAHIKLAYLPEAGKVRLRLSAYSSLMHNAQCTMHNLQCDVVDNVNKELMCKDIEEQVEKLQKLIGENIYGYDDETISSAIGKLLKQKGAMLATAESCTGGLIGNLITETPGSSAYYKGGIIAYSNELKERLLGVRHETLEQYGAVSEETAIEMARGCLAVTGADYAIATTGISGPTGATDEKPLGLVYIAVAKRIRNEELGMRNSIPLSPSDSLTSSSSFLQGIMQTSLPSALASSVGSPNLGEQLKSEVVCNRYVFTTTRQQHQHRTANQALFDLYKLLNSNE